MAYAVSALRSYMILLLGCVMLSNEKPPVGVADRGFINWWRQPLVGAPRDSGQLDLAAGTPTLNQ